MKGRGSRRTSDADGGKRRFPGRRELDGGASGPVGITNQLDIIASGKEPSYGGMGAGDGPAEAVALCILCELGDAVEIDSAVVEESALPAEFEVAYDMVDAGDRDGDASGMSNEINHIAEVEIDAGHGYRRVGHGGTIEGDGAVDVGGDGHISGTRKMIGVDDGGGDRGTEEAAASEEPPGGIARRPGEDGEGFVLGVAGLELGKPDGVEHFEGKAAEGADATLPAVEGNFDGWSEGPVAVEAGGPVGGDFEEHAICEPRPVDGLEDPQEPH